MDTGELLTRVADQGPPLVAGILIGQASGLYRLICTHNSVCRSAVIHDANHQKLRQKFVAIVNGRESMINHEGEEVAAWTRSIRFNVEIWGLTLFVIIAASMVLAFMDEKSMPGGKAILYGGEIGAGLIVYLLCWRHLKKARHDCFLATKKRDGSTKWIQISGDRAEDGLATRDLTSEEIEKEPEGIYNTVVRKA